MSIIKKEDVANALAQRNDISKAKAKTYVNDVFAIIQEALQQENDVDVYGFGKFSIKENPARQGINPLTKEPIEIKASKSVRFKSSSALKNAIQK